uniref:AAA_12 domain-containing protein n=1 Tax=Parastrongyloides trichosuri TaxID=131310 RepID=A0A0N4Z930_PARTI
MDSSLSDRMDVCMPARKRRPYKSLEALLKSCYDVMEATKAAIEKEKDMGEFPVEELKFTTDSRNVGGLSLTGFIKFDNDVNPSILNKKGYEIGERCNLTFIFPHNEKRKMEKGTLKMFASIFYITCRNSWTSEVKTIFKLEGKLSTLLSNDELNYLLVEAEEIKVSLAPDYGIYFERYEDMFNFLEPLWMTPLGKTLLSLLVESNDYFPKGKNQRRSYGTHWISETIGLNEDQNKALHLAEEDYPISFIQSPPGTGKTTTAAAMIFAQPYHNYLVTSESNRACDALGDAIKKRKSTYRVGSEYEDAFKAHSDKVVPVRIYSTYTKVNKKNTSEYCNTKLMEDVLNEVDEKLSLEERMVSVEYTSLLKSLRRQKEKDLSLTVLSRVRRRLEALDEKRMRIFFKHYSPNVVITTSDYSIKHLKKNFGELPASDKVIVDEASQMSLWSFLFLAASYPMAKFILFGDVNQLPPYIPMDLSLNKSDSTLIRSIIEFLYDMNETPNIELKISYRMHPELLNLVSRSFYDGKLECGVSATEREIITQYLKMPNGLPLAWFDTIGSKHMTELKTSTANNDEAKLTAQFLQSLIDYGYSAKDIGVICMYRGQVSKISDMVSNSDITIDTVDAFQGNEREIIVICTSRTAKHGNDRCSSFLGDLRRINVAISRARCGLFIFGDIHFLMRNKNWNLVAQFFLCRRAVDTANRMNTLFY